MATNLNICTFNCKGYSSSQKELQELCEKYSIVCLQEHWLSRQNLERLNELCDVRSCGASPMDAGIGIHTGRPYGGVGIVWHSSLDSVITPLKLQHDWICGISINCEKQTCVILSVYLPYQSHDNEDPYINCLSTLQSLIDEFETTNVLIFGDLVIQAIYCLMIK